MKKTKTKTHKIHKEDGTTVIQHFKIQEGTILLAPDVQPYFPDSDSVNTALRALLSAIPKTIKRKRSQQHAVAR